MRGRFHAEAGLSGGFVWSDCVRFGSSLQGPEMADSAGERKRKLEEEEEGPSKVRKEDGKDAFDSAGSFPFLFFFLSPSLFAL